MPEILSRVITWLLDQLVVSSTVCLSCERRLVLFQGHKDEHYDHWRQTQEERALMLALIAITETHANHDALLRQQLRNL